MDAVLLNVAVTLLWQVPLGEQGRVAVTGDIVLVPYGTELSARCTRDGRELWRHELREEKGLLNVRARVQGLACYTVPPPRIPGLEGSPRPGSRVVCVAGQAELTCLDAAGGAVRWSARKADGCVLSLHLAGDVDGDGADDLVCCGCNFAECFSGRTGTELWRRPVAGRALWAGPCGDIDGDGFGEVLLQAGSLLVAVSSSAPGEARTKFSVTGVLPYASCGTGGGSFWIAFGGASVWRWDRDGEGRCEWEARERVRAFGVVSDRPVLVTERGLIVRAAEGRWERTVGDAVKAAACASGKVFYVAEGGGLRAFEPGSSRSVYGSRLSADVEALIAEEGGRFLVAVSGGTASVYRVEAGG